MEMTNVIILGIYRSYIPLCTEGS